MPCVAGAITALVQRRERCPLEKFDSHAWPARQDRGAGTVEYRLARPGAMRSFEGCWTITPCEGGSTVALEQRMQPAFVPPPPFKRFLRKALLSKAAHMLRDMQARMHAVELPQRF